MKIVYLKQNSRKKIRMSKWWLAYKIWEFSEEMCSKIEVS